jgi:AraC-like DNA-binding protein
MHRQLIQSIIQKTRRTESPPNYYSGLPPFSLKLAENILLFSRLSYEDLNQKEMFHYRYVLIINLMTCATVVLDNLFFQFCPGSGLLVFPYQFHHFTQPETRELNWLFITFEMPAGVPLEKLKNSVFELNDEDYVLIDKILDLYSDQRLEHSNSIVLLVSQLLYSARITNSNNRSSDGFPGTSIPAVIFRLSRFLYEHISESITISDISKHLAVSESHLRAVFRTSMGISLGRYIAEIRIRRAKDYLANFDMNVSEIAFSCGYNSVYAFSRSFKISTGLSPRQFRIGLRSE